MTADQIAMVDAILRAELVAWLAEPYLFPCKNPPSRREYACPADGLVPVVSLPLPGMDSATVAAEATGAGPSVKKDLEFAASSRSCNGFSQT